MKNLINKMFVIEGILLALIGILFFIKPIESLVIFTSVAGILLVIVGALEIIRCYNKKHKGYYVSNSFINILFGLVLSLYPISTLSTLIFIYGILALVKGLYLSLVSIKFKSFGFNMNTLYYILLIILGVIIIINPVSLVALTPYIIGLYFIIDAILKVYLEYKLL